MSVLPDTRSLLHSSSDTQPTQITLDPRLFHRFKRGLWIALIFALIAWAAYVVREIWIPLAIAFLIAMVLDPVVDRMERRGWSRLWATALIFLCFIAVVGALLYFTVPAVVHQAQTISAQVSQYLPSPNNPAAQQKLSAMLDRADAPTWVRVAIERGMAGLQQTITRSTTWVSQHGMQVISNLIWLIIIPIVAFYALKDFHVIFAKSLLLVPRTKREFVQLMVAEVTTIFAKYMRGLIFVSLMNGLATYLLLLILKMPSALFLGAVAGVLYSIPFLGAIMTLTLVASVAFTVPGVTITYVLGVIAANMVLNQLVFDQIITPRVLGSHVGLHPILSIIALLAGNVLLGILGMILAVPVAASIQVVILTLVPKLDHEIDVSAELHDRADVSISALSEETKEQHLEADATEELHSAICQVVDEIEAEEAETRRTTASA